MALLLAACGAGGGTSASLAYDAGRTQAALQTAHWTATMAAGMPQTYTGVRQVAYLETVAPDGDRIDLQFLETPDAAAAELAAAQGHGYKGAATVGNILVVPHAPGGPVAAADLDQLRTLVRG